MCNHKICVDRFQTRRARGPSFKFATFNNQFSCQCVHRVGYFNTGIMTMTMNDNENSLF